MKVDKIGVQLMPYHGFLYGSSDHLDVPHCLSDEILKFIYHKQRLSQAFPKRES